MPTVADVLIQGLIKAGAPRIFIAPAAGSVSTLTDAARKHGMPTFDAGAPATGAVMAAVTGELGDAPGALLTAADSRDVAMAIAGIRRERSPMIVVAEGARGALASGEATVAKQVLTVDPGSASHWLAHAAQLSMKEPRGPVVLEVASGVAARSALPVAANPIPSPSPGPDDAALDAAADLIGRAVRPLVVVGLGCRTLDDAVWLRAFAEAMPAPVITTLKAKGVVPDPHPLSLGFVADADEIMRRADLVIAVGVDTEEDVGEAWPAGLPVLHVGLAGYDGPRYVPVANVTGAPATVFEELAGRLRDRRRADWDVAEVDRIKRAGRVPPADDEMKLVRAAVTATRQALAPGTVATVEPTLTPEVARAWLVTARGELVASQVSLGTRGFESAAGAPDAFALPAAVAAQLARGEQRVVAFTHARAVCEDRTALGTMVQHRLSVVVVALATGAAEARRRLGDVARARGLPCHGNLRRALTEPGPVIADLTTP